MAMMNENPMPIKDVLGKLSIDELRLKGKRVFIRADFNVPLDDNLRITDDSRIRSTLATFKTFPVGRLRPELRIETYNFFNATRTGGRR